MNKSIQISPNEAARILGISGETVRKKVRIGEIDGQIFLGKGKGRKMVEYILIPIRSLQVYLKSTVTEEALGLLNLEEIEPSIPESSNSKFVRRIKMTDIGQIIRGKRQALDITQAKLSTMLGVSSQTVWNWEKDITFPEGECLLRIMDILGLSRDDLLAQVKPDSVLVANSECENT